jgi:hypothetical protein
MKRIGVREFRDHATKYLAGDEVLAVERHGEPIGFYVPTGKSRQENFAEALERLEQTVQRVLAETGMSEEQLGRLFDLNVPLTDEAQTPRDEAPADIHASRR